MRLLIFLAILVLCRGAPVLVEEVAEVSVQENPEPAHEELAPDNETQKNKDPEAPTHEEVGQQDSVPETPEPAREDEVPEAPAYEKPAPEEPAPEQPVPQAPGSEGPEYSDKTPYPPGFHPATVPEEVTPGPKPVEHKPRPGASFLNGLLWALFGDDGDELGSDVVPYSAQERSLYQPKPIHAEGSAVFMLWAD